MKKWWMIGLMIASVLLAARPGLAGDTRVGGFVKMSIFDYQQGNRNETHSSVNGGFAFSDMILYLYQDITDMISIDLQPEFSVRTGATPSLGKNIGDQRIPPAAIDPFYVGWTKAVIKAVLPYDFELSAGIVKPRFTWDYGAELYWSEEYHGSKFTANDWLGAMHDAGLEIYRTFELGELTLPAYLYILNGGYEFTDNNRHPMVMVHVEPEIMGIKLLGSYAQGKWDDDGVHDMQRVAGGLEYSIGDLTVRSEIAAGRWQKKIMGQKDAETHGYYGKVIYRVFPWLKAMVHYSLADHNFNGFFYTAPGPGEKFQTFSPVLQFIPIQSSVIFAQFDRADWRYKDDSELLRFNRITVGWKTTF